MTKREWDDQIRDRLKRLTGTDPVVATATDLMKVMSYKDAKTFKKTFLSDITPCVGKRYSVKDFVDSNYGLTLF